MTPSGKKTQYAMLAGCFILALLIFVGLLLPSILCSAFFVQLSSIYVYPVIAISELGFELIVIFFAVLALCRLIFCDEIDENSLGIKEKRDSILKKQEQEIVQTVQNNHIKE